MDILGIQYNTGHKWHVDHHAIKVVFECCNEKDAILLNIRIVIGLRQ